MAYLIIYIECHRCAGGGTIPIQVMDYAGGVRPPDNPQTCDECGGEGILPRYKIGGDLVDKLDDIMDKCNDIFEKVSE